MKNSGIEGIFVKSGMSKRGTANKVIRGKDYYKMLRYHSLVSEAMIGLLWSTFENFAEEKGLTGAIESLQNPVAMFAQALEDNDADRCKIHMDETKTDLASLHQWWDEFCTKAGMTAKYWMMYIDMCQIVKRQVDAERSGNWTGYLTEVQKDDTVHWSTGHTKYAICLPIYLSEMKALHEIHPDVFESFRQGQFTIHRSKGNFNGIWTDLAMCLNRSGRANLLFTDPKAIQWDLD